MGQPACVMGDKVTGTCAVHQIPNPATGAPQPGPPMPFAAPLVQSLSTTVLIGGKPAAVVGSSGVNTPPHVGLHPADPFMVPTAQIATDYLKKIGMTGSGGSGKGKITVAGFNFSESSILAQIYGQALKGTGYDVSYNLNLGSREVVEPAL